MSEGFDYEAYRQSKVPGGNPDKALIVTFGYEAKKKSDGTFVNVEMVNIWMDKNTEVRREVTPEDRVRFAERYAAFKAGQEVPIDGTPIEKCVFATPADVAACRAERIFTLEQLVETPDERLQRARLTNFKYRSRDFLEARERTGYVGELRDQIDALKAQIETLKERLWKPADEQASKRGPGRPRKVDGNVTQPG